LRDIKIIKWLIIIRININNNKSELNMIDNNKSELNMIDNNNKEFNMIRIII
jgi:hypothetical protein